MPQPPALTDEQRQAALRKAADVRRARAELKERIKSGAVTLHEVFVRAEKDEVIGKTKALTILESLPGVGKITARRAMAEIGIAESRRVRGLGEQQRAALLATFPAES
jgi:hypothetical protein